MDARIRYTKAAIRTNFLDILSEKPLDKVTVTEICSKAEINRATFYKYYDNPYDLLKQLEQERLDAIQEELTNTHTESLRDFFHVILHDIEDHKDFYKILFSENGDSEFRRQIFASCYHHNMEIIRQLFPNLDAKYQQWLFLFIANGCNGLLQEWIIGGMTTPYEEILFFCETLIDVINNMDVKKQIPNV